MASSIEPRRSGRFILRMPGALHEALHRAARAADLSLNEYCVRRLSTGGPAPEDAAKLVAHAAEAAGGGLAGLILHGSWVRGEASSGSDVDALVVVDSGVALRRSLYRAWDRRPAVWSGRPVDPHFVHFPADQRVSGLWAEVATHGLTLFDRAGAVGSTLARVRAQIADGRLRRRVSHGQPYWTEAA